MGQFTVFRTITLLLEHGFPKRFSYGLGMGNFTIMDFMLHPVVVVHVTKIAYAVHVTIKSKGDFEKKVQ